MPNRPPRGEGITRQRILEAAIKRFGQHSYDDTSLRDIANDVHVDVAYVHRSFGSKEKLFLEALRAASKEIDLSSVERENLPGYLVRTVFDQPRGKLVPDTSAFDIVTRSLSSPHVSGFLSQRIQDEFVTPLARKFGNPDGTRVLMVMSLLVGFGLLRDSLKLPVAVELSDQQAEFALIRTIREIATSSNISSTAECP
ncbi:TetR family transcriptional regulator [Mesorhizobium sp. SB112]|uniref:TetR family transcriptional regulator n=1 Tax=Mesorhizobium sp. SB112 TaxID=3151853 RepID=UPI0032670F9B